MVLRGKENITYKNVYYSSLYVLRLNTNLTYLLELKFSNPNISRTPIDDRNADRSSYQRNRYRISLFPSSSINYSHWVVMFLMSKDSDYTSNNCN